MDTVKQEKWIVKTQEGLVLTLKGFNDINSRYSEVRLFSSESSARQYIAASKYFKCQGLTYHRVLVTIEEI